MDFNAEQFELELQGAPEEGFEPSSAGGADAELVMQHSEASKFDEIVAALEDVVLDPAFEDRVEAFFRQHCYIFQDTDENKLEYTTHFETYTAMIESTLLSRLGDVPGFQPGDLETILEQHAEDLVGEVFDVLVSLGDFETFKNTMLAWKEQVENEQRRGLANGSSASASSAPAAQTAADWISGFARPKVCGGADVDGAAAAGGPSSASDSCASAAGGLSSMSAMAQGLPDFSDLAPTVIPVGRR